MRVCEVAPFHKQHRPGYCFTVHKAQGSSWDNVILFDDGFGRTAIDRNRWLYTAITRAERGLVILA